jgi:hypothetical protein
VAQEETANFCVALKPDILDFFHLSLSLTPSEIKVDRTVWKIKKFNIMAPMTVQTF